MTSPYYIDCMSTRGGQGQIGVLLTSVDAWMNGSVWWSKYHRFSINQQRLLQWDQSGTNQWYELSFITQPQFGYFDFRKNIYLFTLPSLLDIDRMQVFKTHFEVKNTDFLTNWQSTLHIVPGYLTQSDLDIKQSHFIHSPGSGSCVHA